MGKRGRIKLPYKDYKTLCLTVFERDKYSCKVCRYRADLHAHHVKFRSQGGDDATYNLITVCSDCHEAIHNRYVVIISAIEGEPINIDTEQYKMIAVNGWTPKRKVR